VAQLVRASPWHGEGRRFESDRVHWRVGRKAIASVSKADGRNPMQVRVLHSPFMINFLNQNILIIAVVILLLIIWNIFLQILILRIRKKIRIFLKGRKVKDLEEVISEQLKRMRNIEGDIKDISKWNENLQNLCDISITKIGVVRFNPFKDTGGDQSFVIALLDSSNSGLVLSSLYTREGNRVYAKPIEKGKSIYHLSKEEETAINNAVTQKLKKNK
jgi:hypothetical protein